MHQMTAWEFFLQGLVLFIVSFGVSTLLCKFFAIAKRKEDKIGARFPGEKD